MASVSFIDFFDYAPENENTLIEFFVDIEYPDCTPLNINSSSTVRIVKALSTYSGIIDGIEIVTSPSSTFIESDIDGDGNDIIIVTAYAMKDNGVFVPPVGEDIEFNFGYNPALGILSNTVIQSTDGSASVELSNFFDDADDDANTSISFTASIIDEDGSPLNIETTKEVEIVKPQPKPEHCTSHTRFKKSCNACQEIVA